MKKKIWKLGLLALFAAQAEASGYKIEFQSASTLADAGDAAVVEDAGTNWYNSAGLVNLPLQVVMSGIDVYAPTTFHGTVIAPSTLNGPEFPPFVNALSNNYAAVGTASSHPNSMLPAFHASYPMSDKVALGFSFAPAWGFTENYGEGSILRYNLTRVYTKTLAFSPSIAWKINDKWSLGFGPDMHYFSAQSKTRVRTESLAPSLVGTAYDSVSRFSANDWSWGGHVGVLYNWDQATRIGLNYRTRVQMNLSGYSDFALDGPGTFESNNFSLPIGLPATTSVSLYHDMTPRWAMMGTASYDQWSSIQNYHARNYIQPPTPANPSGVLPNVNLIQNMHNTIDLSIGTKFKLNDKWLLRASFKYEPTPTSNHYRYVDFPDGIKYGVQIGSRFQATKKIALDFIYGHVFVSRTNIHDINPVSLASAQGHNNTTIDLLGGQLVWDLC